ncbi:MAG TPA: hypothetical protein VJ140_09685, partial [Actinomycetota bacterium]|nr:hypothetical protein [Actinomycetota bacterium]
MREPADVPMVRQHLPAVPQLHRLELIGCCSGAASVLPLIHPGEDTARPARWVTTSVHWASGWPRCRLTVVACVVTASYGFKPGRSGPRGGVGSG